MTHTVSDLHHFLDIFSTRYSKSCISISLISLIFTLFAPSISVGDTPLDHWTSKTANSTVDLYGIAYDGSGTLVAVGYGCKIVTSSNGTDWISRSDGTADYDLNGVAYGNSKFVAVGTVGRIFTSSTNGTTWDSQISGAANLNGIVYGNGLFVAVGSSGTIMTSPDGTTWTVRTPSIPIPGITLYAVAYGNNLYVAVGASGKAVYSADGITWTTAADISGTPLLYGIAYGNGNFVAVGDAGKFTYSANGSSWTVPSAITGIPPLHAIAYGNGKFVAVGNSGKIYSLPDTIRRASISSLTLSGSTATATSNAHNLANGDPVSITGADQVQYNGNFTSQVLNSNTFTYTVSGTPASPATGASIVWDGPVWTSRTSGTTHFLAGIVYASPTFFAVGWTLNPDAAIILQSANTNVYTVTGTGSGVTGSISPASISVDHNYTTPFLITPAANYHLASVSGCGGSAASNLSVGTNYVGCTNSLPCTYTIPAADAPCDVSVTFTSDQYSVTAVPNTTPSGHGMLASDSPNQSPVSVDWGQTATFKFNSQANYHVASVSGCGGTEYNNTSNAVTTYTYTTGAITGTCQVTATFAINTFTVTSTVSGANGTISPTVTVNYGATPEFTLTPEPNYHSSASGCSGALVGNAYTTGAITADCTVTASFPIDTHTVTTHVAGSGSISPENPVVTYNVTQDFTVTPSANYHLNSVTGSGCTIALVSGTTYRTGAVTDNCSITATFGINTYEITPSMVGNPPNGTISPADTTPVDHGVSQLFEFFPSDGYHVKAVVIDAGTADEISLGANTNSYTFGTEGGVTASHTISVEFEQNAAVQRTVLTSANTGGTVSCTPNPVTHGSNTLCTITPTAGYHLQTLLDNNLSKTWVTNGSAFEYTAQIVETDGREIKATFELYITSTATPSAGGTVDTAGIDPVLGRVSIPTGGSAQYSITPNTGYHIASVTLDDVAVPLTSWNTYVSNPYTVDVGTTNRTIVATFAKNTYTITPTVTPGGSISPSGVQTVLYGGSQSFTFIAEDGNQVSEVLVNGNAVTKGTSWSFDNVTSNQTLKVSFALYTYDITIAAGAGGKINASGSLTANWGESRTFTIVPDTGYHIVDVTLDGASIKSQLSSTNTYVLSNIKAVHTIAATFAIDTFTITATSDSNGSITPSGAVTVNYGNTKIYTITPKDGYHILDVKVDDASVSVTDGTYTFADIAKDHTIAVTFSINTYSIIASAGANGTISPSGTTTVENATSKTYTITPGEIYHVSDVKVDGSSVGAVTSYQFTNITANHTIEATFEMNAGTYTINVSRTGMGNGVVTSSPSGINCGVTCSKTVNADTTVTLTAVKDSGSEFGGWIGGGCSGTDTCTVSKNADATVTAVFNVPGQVSLTISKIGTGNGDVKLTASSPGVVCGSGCIAYTIDEKKRPTLVKLTAKVNPDSKFSGWSGDCALSKLKTTCSVTMLSAKAAIANFDLKVPNIVATPAASLPFGTAKVVKNKVKAVTKVVKITNKGDGILKISNAKISGDPDFTLILSSSVATVKPKASISLRIKFNPTSAGAKSAELQISSNDPVKPLVTVALSGTRTAVSARVSKASDESMFYPDEPVTREEAAAFVIRAVEGEPQVDYCKEDSFFTDVSPDAWSCNYVKRLYELGLINGCLTSVKEAGFCPETLMTREQIAALIVKTIDGDPEVATCEAGSPYSDIAPERWSCSHIKRFNELGIDTGYDAHNLKVYIEGMKFYPEVPATRAETATYLIRAIEGEPPADYCKSGSPFYDVTNNNPSCRYIKRLYEIWTSPRAVR